MKNEPKKPDLRDKTWEPHATVDVNDRKFVEEKLPGDSEPHIVSPDTDVHVPGQTTKQ